MVAAPSMVVNVVVYSSNSSTTTTAGYNTAIGYQALGSNTSGS
jgi:hypothetical protein